MSNIYQSKYKGQVIDQTVNDTASLKERMGQAETDIQYLNTYKANSNIVPKSIKDLVPDASLIYIGKEEPIGDYTVWIYPVDDTYATMKTKINDVWTNVTIEDLQAEKERINKLKYYGDPDIEISPDEWFTFANDEHTILTGLSEGHKDETDIVIPYSVTSIGSFAFCGCSLARITIPNSVESINQYAFRGCSSLTSITIPNSVESINQYAFRGCSSLTSITIPNSVTSMYSSVFEGCSNVIIYCSQGSYAETYAKEHNIPVKYPDIAIDNELIEHSENAVSSGAVYSACDSLDSSIREAKQIAQSVRDDADRGVFNGYTPMRGTDYWTEADKAEIKGYVDDKTGDIKTALDDYVSSSSSESDNGKFLQMVNGKATWVALTNAEEVAF